MVAAHRSGVSVTIRDEGIRARPDVKAVQRQRRRVAGFERRDPFVRVSHAVPGLLARVPRQPRAPTSKSISCGDGLFEVEPVAVLKAHVAFVHRL